MNTMYLTFLSQNSFPNLPQTSILRDGQAVHARIIFANDSSCIMSHLLMRQHHDLSFRLGKEGSSPSDVFQHPGRKKNMEVEHPQRNIILTLNIGDIYDPCFDLCVPRMALCCSPATATFIAIRRLTATSRTLRRVIFLGTHKKNHRKSPRKSHMNSHDLITKKTKKTDLIQKNP